jgi:ankyrin repeat protein
MSLMEFNEIKQAIVSGDDLTAYKYLTTYDKILSTKDIKKLWNLVIYKKYDNPLVVDFILNISSHGWKLDIVSDIDYYIERISGNNLVGVMEVFLKNKIYKFRNDNDSIVIASACGHVDIVQTLLADERFDPSIYENEAIKLASSNGYTEVVKLLLEDERVDPSADYSLSFSYAYKNNHIEVVKLLLKDGRINFYDNQCLSYSCRHGYEEIIELLLSNKKVNTSSDDNYTIILSVMGDGFPQIINLLLNRPPNDTVETDLIKKVISKEVDFSAVKLSKLFELCQTLNSI